MCPGMKIMWESPGTCTKIPMWCEWSHGAACCLSKPTHIIQGGNALFGPNSTSVFSTTFGRTCMKPFEAQRMDHMMLALSDSAHVESGNIAAKLSALASVEPVPSPRVPDSYTACTRWRRSIEKHPGPLPKSSCITW